MIVKINARGMMPSQVRTELDKYGITLPENHDFEQFVEYKIDTETKKIVEDQQLLARAIKDNPDLPRDFVAESILSEKEVESGRFDVYKRRTHKER